MDGRGRDEATALALGQNLVKARRRAGLSRGRAGDSQGGGPRRSRRGYRASLEGGLRRFLDAPRDRRSGVLRGPHRAPATPLASPPVLFASFFFRVDAPFLALAPRLAGWAVS
jgi:hypothetical protein